MSFRGSDLAPNHISIALPYPKKGLMLQTVIPREQALAMVSNNDAGGIVGSRWTIDSGSLAHLEKACWSGGVLKSGWLRLFSKIIGELGREVCIGSADAGYSIYSKYNFGMIVERM